METVTAQCQRIHNKADGKRRGTGRAKFFFLKNQIYFGKYIDREIEDFVLYFIEWNLEKFNSVLRQLRFRMLEKLHDVYEPIKIDRRFSFTIFIVWLFQSDYSWTNEPQTKGIT